MKLVAPLKFWYQYQPTKDNFNESLTPISVFHSVEGFWSVYQHFQRPSNLEDNTYLYLFRENVKPVWEDPANLNGGCFILRFAKDKSDKVWEDILLAFVAANTSKFEFVNGIRFKIRKTLLVIEVWVSDVQQEKETESIRDWIIKATCLNVDTPI